MVERVSRGRARYYNTTGRNRPPAGARLGGIGVALAVVACVVPLLLGFVLPATVLLKMALAEGDAQFGARFLLLSRNSFVLAGITACIGVLLALLMAYGARLLKSALATGLNRLVGLGYAVPGTVIAVGVLIPVTRLDNWLVGQWEAWFGINPGLLLTGGIAALIYAYLARFLSVALQTVDASLAKITPTMDDAVRSLGLGQGHTLHRVHVAILRGSLFTAGLLVFVDANQVGDMHVADLIGAKVPALGVFTFRAMLNIAMLVTESERAKAIRSRMLDIVLDVVAERTGGHTRFINQRDKDYLPSAFMEDSYRKQFTNALRDHVDMGNHKYAVFTDKIYQAVFCENAREYKQVLRLAEGDSTRDTMYAEVLKTLASLESGLAATIQQRAKALGRKLKAAEVDQLLGLLPELYKFPVCQL